MSCNGTVERGGNTESGRLAQILAAQRQCATQEAIKKARSACCPATPVSRTVVPLESTNLIGRVARCAEIGASQASFIASQSFRGVPESVRIKAAQECVVRQYQLQNPYEEFQGPRAVFVCPPIPTEITNANLPKPSTRCATLNLLATGKPPNSIFTSPPPQAP
jgi:hypothetical protein